TVTSAVPVPAAAGEMVIVRLAELPEATMPPPGTSASSVLVAVSTRLASASSVSLRATTNGLPVAVYWPAIAPTWGGWFSCAQPARRERGKRPIATNGVIREPLTVHARTRPPTAE